MTTDTPEPETFEARHARAAWDYITRALAVDPAATFRAEYRALAERHAPLPAPAARHTWSDLV